VVNIRVNFMFRCAAMFDVAGRREFFTSPIPSVPFDELRMSFQDDGTLIEERRFDDKKHNK